MKLLTILLLSLSFSAFAKDVNGTITYKLPSGNLVDREVVLNVPSRGQGEVVLSGKSFEWRSTNFNSVTVAGNTIFTVVFETEFRGQKSFQLFKGTYLKGGNKLIYQGDLFKAKSLKAGFKHAGVFNFGFIR